MAGFRDYLTRVRGGEPVVSRRVEIGLAVVLLVYFALIGAEMLGYPI